MAQTHGLKPFACSRAQASGQTTAVAQALAQAIAQGGGTAQAFAAGLASAISNQGLGQVGQVLAQVRPERCVDSLCSLAATTLTPLCACLPLRPRQTLSQVAQAWLSARSVNTYVRQQAFDACL